ncbi:MAG TPA: AbrB/MazE/SpoVT family DNA-binding domain-containing protein [Terriglobales bacterium]|nr:AbrB/MazE/SpoVT family DNA-binding domain-containing protein [Terriglobales bacterium]
MTFSPKITSKGQVTIPLGIRKKLGLRSGDRVEFSEHGTDVVIRRAQNIENPFDRYKGMFKGLGSDIRSVNRWLADLRDDEDDS